MSDDIKSGGLIVEDSWYTLAAMPGWVYVDTGGSAEDGATLLQVNTHI